MPAPAAAIAPFDLSSLSPDPPRTSRLSRAFPALGVRNYRVFVASQIVASTGVWMQRVAQDWLVLSLTHSPTAVGITTAAQFLPMLLFGLFGGVVADRYPKRRLLLITQSGMGLLAATLAGLTLSGHVGVYQVYGVAFVLGLLTVVDNPARQLFVNEMVGPVHLRNAISLNSSIFQLGGLLGPAVSGLLITAVGAGWAFGLNALSYVAVISALLLIRQHELITTRVAPHRRGQLAEGLRYVAARPELIWPIVLVGFVGTFGLNLPIVLTGFATSVFPTGAAGYGLFNTLVALGSLGGALLAARRRSSRLRSIVFGAACFGAVEAVTALAPTRASYAVALVGVGASALSFQIAASATVQLATDTAIRGRVMSVYMMVLIGGTPIGSPIIGWVTEQFGARIGMLACGVVPATAALVVAGLILRAGHLRLRIDPRGRRLDQILRLAPAG